MTKEQAIEIVLAGEEANICKKCDGDKYADAVNAMPCQWCCGEGYTVAYQHAKKLLGDDQRTGS